MRGRRLLLAAAGAVAAFGPAGAAGAVTRVSVAHSRAIARTSPRYISYAVDLDQITGGMFWSQAPNARGKAPVAPYDFTRVRLRRLAAALGPAYLRISGTAANHTYYDLGGSPTTAPPAGYNLVLTRREWDAANAFARAVRAQIILGVNGGQGPRDASGHWSSGNAAALLRYTAQHHDPLAVVEFGNEPNLYALNSGFPATYGAADYVAELRRFDALRRRIVPGTRLMGPGNYYDNTGSETPYADYAFGPLAGPILGLAGRLYSILTFHEYPATSSRCGGVGSPVPADPLRPSYLDGVLSAYRSLTVLGARDDPGARIWYGEAGSASCGGQQGYSDRFEATFWYLNALGQLANHGLQVFVRQTLSGSDYGLINESTLRPNPDYWAALLWHRLMGTRILRPIVRAAPSRVRVFASCTPGGGTTLLALNLDAHHDARMTLADNPRDVDVYAVDSPALLGGTARLNGRVLRVGAGGTIPALRPRRTRARTITLRPASYAFVLQPGVSAAGCR